MVTPVVALNSSIMASQPGPGFGVPEGAGSNAEVGRRLGVEAAVTGLVNVDLNAVNSHEDSTSRVTTLKHPESTAAASVVAASVFVTGSVVADSHCDRTAIGITVRGNLVDADDSQANQVPQPYTNSPLTSSNSSTNGVDTWVANDGNRCFAVAWGGPTPDHRRLRRHRGRSRYR